MDRNLLEAVEHGGVVADGSMGGSLYERGVYVNRNFDEINLEQSQLVFQIHRDYLLAGAHLLETNTYGANRMRLARHGLGDKTSEINRRGVETALRAADGAAWVIGSIGPTGLNPSHLRRSESEVAATFIEQATALRDAGAHAWIIETFSHPEELRIALRAIRPLSDMPLIAQFKAAADGKLIDGTSRSNSRKSFATGVPILSASTAVARLKFLISQPQWSSRISRFAPCQMQARRKLLKIAKCISRRPRTSASSHVDSTKRA